MPNEDESDEVVEEFLERHLDALATDLLNEDAQRVGMEARTMQEWYEAETS